jgi:hypothetical protein
MKPHDGIVTEAVLARMARWTRAGKRKGAVEWLDKREPELGAFIDGEIQKIAGRLGLSGAPPNIVQGAAQDMQILAAQIYVAMDLGHGALWKGWFEGPATPAKNPATEDAAREGKKTE